MAWAGTKEEFKEYKNQLPYLRSKDIEGLAVLIYNEFQNLFEYKKVLITGSPIFSKLNLIDSSIWGDLDLNVIVGEEGDQIIFDIKDFLENSDLEYVKFKFKKWDHLAATCGTSRGGIDFFRNKWGDEDIVSKIEVFPEVFSYYLTDDYMVRGEIRCFKRLKELKNQNPEIYNKKLEKHKNTLQLMLMRAKNLPDNIINELKLILNEKI